VDRPSGAVVCSLDIEQERPVTIGLGIPQGRLMQPSNEVDRLTVLSVDDEEYNNELVRRTLRAVPRVTVITVSSGQQALALLRDRPVHVVLLDQSMPGMTGVQVLEQVAAVAPTIAVAIMVTGFPELKEVMRALESGLVSQIVVKPWTPKELIAAVERALAVLDIQGVARRMAQYKDGTAT